MLLWLLGSAGVTAMMGVAIHPRLTAAWLYPRLVWGGLWGLLFLVPLLRGRPVARGLVFGLAPSAAMLAVVFPGTGKGVLGVGLGALTPLLVLAMNAVWGVTASLWERSG
nr:hypothetical protein [Dissulfurirhabdus thermomarina]